MDQKGVTGDHFQKLLDTGVLADLFDPKADFSNREAFRAALKLGTAASKPSVLKLVNGDVALDAIAAYDPSALKSRKGVWVSDDFVLHVRLRASPVENLGQLSLSSHELMKNTYEREITPGLGENYIFYESELCARIDQMISKQPNGEKGDLLTNNGHANIFYVAGYVVHVRWLSDYRKWDVDRWDLGDDRWRAGDRVFARN
ncbi:hypothetical protein H0X32_04145 [Patescibacteria group bacterium]|nr:hypothetical protein [Patescibacteria group bacterium]